MIRKYEKPIIPAIFKLKRYFFAKSCTIGKLYSVIDGVEKFLCDTLELPVTSNKLVHDGTYTIHFGVTPPWSRFFDKKGYEYQIRLSVPYRNGILIHCGNTAADTTGCVLVGQCSDLSSCALRSSRETYSTLVSYIKDTLGWFDHSTTITIAKEACHE